MRALLDTHIMLAVVRGNLDDEYPQIAQQLRDSSTESFVSVASLWEMAIKTRLGKLDPGMKLEEVAGYLEAVGVSVLPISAAHVTTAIEPEPKTRDPFDRLLLGQCMAEDLMLVTVDRALLRHPLAMKRF
ncbi:MAG TPA: type II toxin-antitoxin system VapC family toxin [Micropepsaceae bacterium]|nr:type II toxin-antitoxin system VapC family toxin [Micropepsaceae bacterium]